jgi:hypothetical protein
MGFKTINQWNQLFDRSSIHFDRHLVYRFEIYFMTAKFNQQHPTVPNTASVSCSFADNEGFYLSGTEWTKMNERDHIKSDSPMHFADDEETKRRRGDERDHSKSGPEVRDLMRLLTRR